METHRRWRALRDSLGLLDGVKHKHPQWLGLEVGSIPLVVARAGDCVQVIAAIGRCQGELSAVLAGVRHLQVGGVVEQNGFLLLREVRPIAETRPAALMRTMARLASAAAAARSLAGAADQVDELFLTFAD